MLKIKAFENNREKLVSLDYVVSRELRGREIYTIDAALKTSRTINLLEHPIYLSERIVMNGIELTEGVGYDYTIVNNIITFNIGILSKNGHVLTNYKYLNIGV